VWHLCLQASHREDVLRAVLKSERIAYSLERRANKPVPWSSLLARDIGLPEVHPCLPNQICNPLTRLPVCRPSDVTRLLLRDVLNRARINKGTIAVLWLERPRRSLSFGQDCVMKYTSQY
jgi:hypothetical protein